MMAHRSDAPWHQRKHMRVLIITYHFPPDSAVGAVRPYQMARLLPAHGIEPWVLTVRPEFAEARDDTLFVEGIPPERVLRTTVGLTTRGRLLKQASSLKTALRDAAQRIAMLCDAAPSAAAPRSLARRDNHSDGWLDATPRRRWLLAWLDFPDRMAGWHRPGVAAGEAAIRRVGFDAILSSSPPRTVHSIAHHLAVRHGLPWVMDLRDPWYRNSNALPSPTLEALQQRLFIKYARRADVVVLNTERLRRHVADVTPQLVTKITAIPNGCIPQAQAATKDESNGPRQFSIGHYGNVYSTRSAEPFLRGLRLWLDRSEAGAAEVVVRFVGHESGDAPRHIERLKLGAVVQLCPPVGRNRLPALMHENYVLLLMANDMPLQVPGKLFEYLAAGRRVLATTEPDSPAADMLRHARDCIVAPNAEAVAQALQELWHRYREGAPAAVDHGALLDECSYERRVEQMAQVLKSVRPSISATLAGATAATVAAP